MAWLVVGVVRVVVVVLVTAFFVVAVVCVAVWAGLGVVVGALVRGGGRRGVLR